jgi:hypothetical protein
MTSTNDQTLPTPVAKKKGRKKWVVAAILAVGVLGGIAIGHSGPSTTAPASTAAPAAPVVDPATAGKHEVIYHVTGTAATVDLTMSTPGGGTSQQSGLRVPVMNNNGDEGLRTKMDRGEFAYVSAQNNGSSGSVTCEIEVDGVTVEHTTSSGAYVIASCSTLVGL